MASTIRIASVPPGLASAPRITTLVASLLVALSSGTNYVYSAYAPQLGARLHITHTQLNIVGFAGNIGVYSSGPIWGRIVDMRGPRILLACAFVLLLSGYSGMRHLYDSGDSMTTTLSTFKFSLLVACSYMTGAGGNGGLTSAVNATAKTFPDRARASTTGLVIGGFGLSAFFFSTIAHLAFAGNTSTFLFVLALGTSFPMIFGFFLIRPIPLPPSELGHSLEHGFVDPGHGGAASSTILVHEDESRTRLLAHDDSEEAPLRGHGTTRIDLELSPTRSTSQEHHRRRSLGAGSEIATSAEWQSDGFPNIYGLKLWSGGDFWLLCSILSLLSGTGLMYINNVGSMSQALYAKGNPVYDEVEASRWQAEQVSAISLMNFSGRIFIGLVSDFAKNRLALPRSYFLVLVSFFFFISQVAAANVADIRNLYIASALLGLAHGSVFSLFPTVCIEWFGLPHFSENWGYISMSPMFAGNLFSLAFGRNLDAHEPVEAVDLAATPNSTQCLLGRECYVDTLYLTIAGCFLSMLLSVWAGWRDRQKIAATTALRRARAEVTWETGED